MKFLEVEADSEGLRCRFGSNTGRRISSARQQLFSLARGWRIDVSEHVSKSVGGM